MKPTVAKANCTILADLLASYGVEHVVLCPGSRNAPVSLAIERSGKYRTHVIIDERSGAFAALGMAKETGRPVAVAVTSGTALLNCAPAVAEAYYARVPLIIVSADRPERWIDQRDSQTIRQPEALANIVRDTVDAPDTLEPSHINLLINRALTAATCNIPGPVHINLPLDKPLTALIPSEKAVRGHKIHTDFAISPSPEARADIYVRLANMDKVLVVAGSGCDLRGARFGGAGNIALLADLSANCADAVCSPTSFDSRILGKDLEPDVIVNLGGTVVSDHFKAFLRRCSCPTVNIGFDDAPVDTFGRLERQIQISPRVFMEQWDDYIKRSGIKTGSEYSLNWRELYGEEFSIPWTEKPSDYETLLHLNRALMGENKKKDLTLFLANGMTARYAQLFRWPAKVLDQRGVSGIEGCTSTAAGASLATDSTVLLLTGDMGAAYDIGALATPGLRGNFKIAVTDNGGGDIFRHVATTRDFPETERLFAAAPQLPLQQLAQAYGFNYYTADSPDNLKEAITLFLADQDRPAILHVKTDPDANQLHYSTFLSRK